MITILPTKVKLLHFPRSHLPHVTHAIVKTCFFKESTSDPAYFFSFTENAYEISIVASQEVIDNEFIPRLTMAQCHEMRASPDIFRVLQVDDEGGQETSGRRISDLSRPLAQEKFSIFYMSTYQTDFVLIKERRLRQAVLLLQKNQFEFDEESITNTLGESPIQSAVDESRRSIDSQTSMSQEEFEKSVLDDQLICVGLNPHFQQEWSTILLKMVSYPELILPGYTLDQTRFFSFTADHEGVSLIANQNILNLFSEDAIFIEEALKRYRVIQVNLAGSNLDRCGIVWSISHPLATEAHINLLYLSTFKSANILVSVDDLSRAEEILADDFENVRGMLGEVVLEPL